MRVVGRGWLAMVLGLMMVGLGCREVVEVPSALAYSANPAIYVTGTTITPNSPTHSGGAIDSYAVSPALPDGLNLDTKSGVISGAPTVAAATASYTVTGTNSAGSTTVGLSITVNDTAITITTQPQDQSILVGQTATFSITATGMGTFSYQWSKNGVDISGAISASYTTPSAVLADSGSTFSVLVSSTLGGSATSKTATLTVLAAGPGTCIATDTMSTSRSSATATLLPSGKVLIVGGYNGTSLGSAELFDPASGTFTTTGSLIVPREYHTATLLATGKVLVAGGIVTAWQPPRRKSTIPPPEPFRPREALALLGPITLQPCCPAVRSSWCRGAT